MQKSEFFKTMDIILDYAKGKNIQLSVDFRNELGIFNHPFRAYKELDNKNILLIYGGDILRVKYASIVKINYSIN